MRKFFIIILLICLFYIPNGYCLDNYKLTSFDYVYLLDGANYNQSQSCDGDNSILGNVNDEESVAWLLQQVLDFIKIGGPILVVVLSSIEYIKVTTTGDEDAMKKANKRLINRLILVILLFFIPTIVEALLDVFGFTSSSTCGLS